MAEIAGLKLIVPSSVAGSGVSVSASGKVSFTAATTININGVFSSTYDNYLIVTRMLNSIDGALLFRWRLSGSDASGSNYTEQRILANGASVGGQRLTSQTSAAFMWPEQTYGNGAHFYAYGPALAQPTASRSVTVYGASGAEIADWATTHSLSTAYDGITLYEATTGSLTGSLTVYGLSQ